MKTSFEQFAAWQPAHPERASLRPRDADAQQRWEGEGGNQEIRRHHVAGDTAAGPADDAQTDLGSLYASYAQAWRARFGTPAPFASAVTLPGYPRGSARRPSSR